MRQVPFSVLRVDKEESLKIIQELSQKMPGKPNPGRADPSCKHYCLNHKMMDPHNEDLSHMSLGFTHKLCVTTIDLSEAPERDYTSSTIEDYYQDILAGKYDDQCEQSDEVEIYACNVCVSKNGRGECINFEAYLYDVAECDVSYPMFIYDHTLKCWITRDRFWNAESGIDVSEGRVIILDFSDYGLGPC
jgi:hypothetical protein